MNIELRAWRCEHTEQSTEITSHNYFLVLSYTITDVVVPVVYYNDTTYPPGLEVIRFVLFVWDEVPTMVDSNILIPDP
jgi:hypothetical protein